MEELLAQLAKDGFEVPNLKLNSRIIRFDRNGKKNGWFVGFEGKTKKEDTFIIASYGDWKTGEKYEHRTKREYTKVQDREILRKLQEHKRSLDMVRSELQEDAKSDANRKWNDGFPNNAVEYLSRKGIKSLYGCRSNLGNDGRVLLVPMRDIDGELWGLQTIYPDSSKYFLTGQRINGTFHTLHSSGRDTDDTLSESETIYICEGFATAASIHQATEQPVVCAFNAQNLVHVSKALKEKYPSSSFIICGDNDQFTERNGQPFNPGREFADKAAKACAGKAIFPVFSNLQSLPTDFNDLHILEGLEVLKEQILGVEKPNKQYILPLGFYEDRYYYTSSQNKHIKSLSASNHTKLQLLNFLGLEYWESLYPAKNEDGVDWTSSVNDLMSKCRKKGSFNLNNVRASGAWLGDKKELVLNKGDCLIVNGQKKDFHSLRSKYIYEPGDLNLLEPSDNYLSNGQCQDFLEALAMLRWAHKDSYKFLAGWLMIAPVCGALDWRPHIWLSGPSGSGKSTIMNEVVHRLLEPASLSFQGQSTEAGIRQSLGKKAVPVVFDEFETNDEKSGARVGQIVELIRQASYETNAPIVKGSAEGTSINYLPRFMAIVSAVNVNLTFEADKNRFTVLELLRQSANAYENMEQFQKFKEKLSIIDDEWVHGWYSRIFKLWDVFMKNKELLFKVISERYSARFGQQYSALLAGFALCEQETPVCSDYAKYLVDTTDLELKNKEQDESDEQECLNYLLGKKVYVNGSINRDASVFEMIEGATTGGVDPTYHGSRSEWEKNLKLYGMCIKDNALIIANNYSELNDIFRGTKWTKIYDRSLKRIQGADNNGNKAVKLSGSVRKVTRIPLSAIELSK